ncbi:oxidoreductase [Leifsonia poae]|uniref:oxidoreductase n=1 Tax=Leifsonia poae TaxID=110933 RepID=UPI001CBB4293|nr:oxidoreductase [Leifsonia poae]
MDASIAIVGPGSIGTTVAAALYEAGHALLLCGRTAREQLVLEHPDGTVVVPGPVLTDPGAVDSPVDLVFLAVKATQTNAATPWLRALCGPGTTVCVLQNGVEQVASVAPLVPESSVVPAVVWFPSEARDDGSVLLRAPARLTVPDTDAAHRIRDAFDGTRCAVETTDDFTSVAWRKLLQNALAGFMVLTRRRAGMFSRDDISVLSLAYAEECLQVARADGAVLGGEVPQTILDGFRSSPADLGTSILADREAGRPLEWDVRNGVVQRRGRAHGIPTPLSDILVPLLAAASEGPG